jgi:hypothetical protein
MRSFLGSDGAIAPPRRRIMSEEIGRLGVVFSLKKYSFVWNE